jgi:hypothetical protein
VTEILQVQPAQLMAWAASHDEAAEACLSARADHPRVLEAAESWGPLFHEARRAVVEAVNARESALAELSARHRATAQQLRASAARLGAMDSENRADLTIV